MTEQQQFADDLINLIDRAFENAFRKRIEGISETELLIEHDIEAAYCMVDESLQQTARKSITAAVRAVDANISFHEARAYLDSLLRNEVHA